MRGEEERGQRGNPVSSWALKLPIDEPDTVRQLRRLRETIRELEESDPALEIGMMMAVPEWTPSGAAGSSAPSSRWRPRGGGAFSSRTRAEPTRRMPEARAGRAPRSPATYVLAANGRSGTE